MLVRKVMDSQTYTITKLFYENPCGYSRLLDMDVHCVKNAQHSVSYICCLVQYS